MPLEFDDSALQQAQKLITKSDAVRKDVAKLLKRIKDGYFSGTKVIFDAGLSKDEVQQLVDAVEKTNKYQSKWRPLEKSYKAGLQKAYKDRKAELERELSSLDRERKDAEKQFPDFRSLVGNGPEKDLKQALKMMS